MGIFDELFKKKAPAAHVQPDEKFFCPVCGAITQGAQRKCTNCSWDDSTCPYVTGFNNKEQLFKKCRLKTGNNDCSANPYGLLFEDCPIFKSYRYYGGRKTAAETAGIGNKKVTSILDKYRAGLLYLDSCESFDEAKFRELNRIIGNQFSEADIKTQLGNAQLMLRGVDDLKKVLRSNIVEAIGTFEEIGLFSEKEKESDEPR